jgi:hypothetical protein
MRTTTTVSLACLALVLVGCGNVPPMVLAASQKDYFGSWEHVSNEYGNNIVGDNMLLIFHPDSTVSYKRCINRMNGYSYTQLPDSRLEKLTDRQLAFSANTASRAHTRRGSANRTIARTSKALRRARPRRARRRGARTGRARADAQGRWLRTASRRTACDDSR